MRGLIFNRFNWYAKQFLLTGVYCTVATRPPAIELLKKQHRDLNTGISLAMDFADLVRRKQPDLLAQWLKKAESSKIRAITGFATKLKDDLDAVTNGVTYQWSNGQVEGQVNQLKMLKRQMYGRASHELLKKRFLCPV